MAAVVIAFCGREIRTAFVANKDANGDARSEAAASIIAKHRVSSYVLATGPMPEPDVKPTLWEFPLSENIDIHTQIARFQRSLGSGRNSLRAELMKAVKATTRTVTPSEIDAYLGIKPKATRPSLKVEQAPMPPPIFSKPFQLSLF